MASKPTQDRGWINPKPERAFILVDILDNWRYTIGIVNDKELIMQQEIEQLEAVADVLFAAGKNYLGNQILEVVYCLEAEAADADDGQPTEQEEWASFDPDC
jgi:hypothetical protein